jgi:hypothetical protein
MQQLIRQTIGAGNQGGGATTGTGTTTTRKRG